MAKTLEAVVKERISLGGTRYAYIGQLKFGEYTGSGGSPVTTVSGVVSALPPSFDYFNVASGGGYSFELVGGTTPKLKAYGSNKTEGAIGIEVADAADLKALNPTFFAIGS